MNFIAKDKIEWKLVKYLRQGESFNYDYELWLNEPLASWDVFDYWERERIESMRTHLKKGDILFDIGTEQGWCNLVYAQMVGPENMVLIEPTQEFWPNIKALWDKNYSGTKPKGFWSGLFGNDDDEEWIKEYEYWPKATKGDLIDRNKYQYLHDNDGTIKQTTVDVYVKLTGFVPDALTMDTEGSEFLILKGAEQTLKNHKPKLWISVHPDMALRDYGVKENQLDNYLTTLGYKGQHLATDHEEHWYYDPL